MKLDNFVLQEIVPKNVFIKSGNLAWSLLNEEFFRDLDLLVTDWKNDLGVKSVTINNWLWGGSYNESGYREPTTSTGAVKSAHKSGLAADLKIKGATISDCYDYLIKNQYRYPAIRRVESTMYTPTWLHVDGKKTNLNKIHVFAP